MRLFPQRLACIIIQILPSPMLKFFAFITQALLASYRVRHTQYLQMCSSLGRPVDMSLALSPIRVSQQQQPSGMAGPSTMSPPSGGRGGGRSGRPPGSGRGRGRPPGSGRGRGRPPLGLSSPPAGGAEPGGGQLPAGAEGADHKRPLPKQEPGDGEALGGGESSSQPPAKHERLSNAGGGSSTVAMSMADMPAEVAVVCNGVRGTLVLSTMRVSLCGCAECGTKGPPESRPVFHPTHWEQHCGDGMLA